MEIQTTNDDLPNQPTLVRTPKPKGGARPGAGRPRTREAKLPAAPSGEPFILPKIPFRRGTNRFEDFVTWWHALTTEQLEKLIVYVYRQWPVCDAKIADPDADSNIEKITGPCPFTADNWRMDILTRYQSGSYCFYVKEGAVQRWTIYASDIVDLVNYPPLIDYKTLMLSAPANKDFVRWARQRNLIANSEENDGMANAAVDRLVDQSDRLVNRVIELSDRQTPAPTDVDTSAQLAGMEMIQRAGERALDVAMKSADRLAEMNSKANDPLELVKAFTDMSSTLHGNSNKEDDRVTRLMESMLEDSRKRADRLEDEMREMRRERRNGGEGGEGEGGEPRGLLARLQARLEDKLLESLDGKAAGESSAAEQSSASGSTGKDSFKTMLLEQAFKQLPQMIGPGGITGLLANGVALIQAARGAAPAPGTTAPLAGAQPDQLNPAQAKPATAMPNNGFPPPVLTGNQVMDELISTTWQMAPTLLFHLHSEDRNGYTFARWLIDSSANGRQNFNYMKEAGKDDLLKMIELYPPLDEALKKTPEKRNAFIDEMLRLDEWEKEQEAAGDDDEDEEEERGKAAVAAGKS